MDNPTHCGVLVGVDGEACATVVLVVNGGVVVLEPDAFGGDGCCDAHAATPTQPITTMASNRITWHLIPAYILRHRRESIAL
jgi:hypothetical protein